MNRRTFVLASCALVVGVAPLTAVEPGVDDPGQKYEGSIARVEMRMLDVQTAQGLVSFTVTETTKISLEGQPVLLDQLKVAQKVSVTASEVDGKLVASVVAARAPDVQSR